jgi:nitric oxide synthase-interacting protein
MCCPKGHIFCKECILENLLIQKKEIKKTIQLWTENQNKLHIEEDKIIEKEKQLKIENLKSIEDGVAQVETEYNIENFLPDEAQREIKIIEECISKNSVNLKEKSENLENCFWIPEKTPNYNNEKISKPSEALYCPTKEKDHIIKVKNLVSLKIDREDDKFSCFVCHRELTVQKIVALSTCGHVLCKVKTLLNV